MIPLTSVQENYWRYQESQKIRDLVCERISTSGEKIPELRKINLDDIIHFAETYTWGIRLDLSYKPLSDAVPELKGTHVGELNTDFPVKLETGHYPGTRRTLIYCAGEGGLEKYSFNSVHSNNYHGKKMNRNPLIEQVGGITGGSLLMGAFVSLFGLGNWNVVPYLYSIGCLGIAGQLALPYTKGDRDEIREDRTAWKLYRDHIKRSE